MQLVVNALFIVGLSMVIAWWFIDGGLEPPSVLVLTLASIIGTKAYKRRHHADFVKTKEASTESDATFGLVEKGFFKSIVQTPGAATRNELSILLLSHYPKWTAKMHIKLSIRSKTQPLDSALDELIELRHIASVFGLFYRLTPLGVSEAKSVVTRHAK